MERPPFFDVARWLPSPPAALYQTYKEDHAPARSMCERRASGLTRRFVNDAECREDAAALGGQWLLDKYDSYQRGSHRCDMWRYIRLCLNGGNYVDTKMALAQPWEATLATSLAEANATAEGRNRARKCQQAGKGLAHPSGTAGDRSLAQVCVAGQGLAQPSGGTGDRSLAQVCAADTQQVVGDADLGSTPYVILSIGANGEHIYQGNIWHVSQSHPLLVYALQEVLRTEEKQLKKRYLLFCEQLWKALSKDLEQAPKPGWNYSQTWGPVYLFRETLRKGFGKRGKQWEDAAGVSMPVDGHFMEMAGGKGVYAATRAWNWSHGFEEVGMQAVLTGQAFQALQAGELGEDTESGKRTFFGILFEGGGRGTVYSRRGAAGDENISGARERTMRKSK